MSTPAELDDQLIDRVIELGGFPTRKAAVTAALTEFVKTLERQQLSALHGKLTWQGNLDALRARRTGRNG